MSKRTTQPLYAADMIRAGFPAGLVADIVSARHLNQNTMSTNRAPMPDEIREYVREEWATGDYRTPREMREHLEAIGLERLPALGTIRVWIGRYAQKPDTIEEYGRRLARDGQDVGSIRSAISKSHGVRITDEMGRRWMTEARLSGLRLDVVDAGEVWARSSAFHTVTRQGAGLVASSPSWTAHIPAGDEHRVLCTLSGIIGDFILYREGRCQFVRYAGGRRYDIPLISLTRKRDAA